MIAATRPLDLVLDRLPGARQNGQGWKALCPSHEDHSPSLSIRLGENGRVLLHCFAGCAPEAIVAGIGLTMADLFPPQERQERPERRVVRETDYRACDAAGAAHGIHRRRDYSDGSKAVFWLQPDGTKGLGGRALDTMPLYGSEDLAARPDDVPIINEGEKAAQALRDAWYLALGTVTGAALAPSRDVLAALAGRREVILWPDNDVPGMGHMLKIALTLAELGIPFRLVTWPDAPEKGDAYDFLARGGDVDALLAAAVAPAWSASPPRPGRIVRAGDLALTEPAYLIDGVLPRNGLAALVAKEASYKSFGAVGMAASILTGDDWAGRATEPGPVLYLAAEGAAGMRRRLKAWEIANRADLGDLWLLPAPVNFLHDADLGDLAGEIEALPASPALLVVDTLSRNFGGANENAPEYMTRFIAACDRLRVLTGACVLIIHHETKLGGYRGHSSFAGALDTLLEARREGTAVTLSCKKQKDDTEFEPIHLAARVVELGFDDRHGRPVTSIVLQPTDRAFVERQRQAVGGEAALSEKERTLLAILNAALGGQITYAEWLRDSGMSGTTFDRVRAKLIERGLVRPLGNRGYAPTPVLPPNHPHGGVTPTPTPVSEMGVGVNLGVDGGTDNYDDELPF